MAQFKVVHVDGQPSADWSIEREILAEAGADLVVAGCTDDEQVVAAAADADAALNTMYFMNRQLFERLPNLKVVVRGGVGYDNLDVDAATDCGIVVCNVIDYGYNEVANHAFALLLALNRKLVPLDRGVRQGRGRPDPAEVVHTGRVAGQTLGLVSLGNIAQAVARRAKGFDLEVIAYDPYLDPEKAAALGVELTTLDDLCRRSDYISIHTPLSKETRGLIGAPELAVMKPSAYVVLTSRGGVIAEDALVEALRDKRIAGGGDRRVRLGAGGQGQPPAAVRQRDRHAPFRVLLGGLRRACCANGWRRRRPTCCGASCPGPSSTGRSWTRCRSPHARPGDLSGGQPSGDGDGQTRPGRRVLPGDRVGGVEGADVAGGLGQDVAVFVGDEMVVIPDRFGRDGGVVQAAGLTDQDPGDPAAEDLVDLSAVGAAVVGQPGDDGRHQLGAHARPTSRPSPRRPRPLTGSSGSGRRARWR